MKPAAFYVPVNLSPDLLPPALREYGHCVLNHLHWRWVCWQVDDSGFAPVMWRHITRLVTRPRWLQVRNLLTGPVGPGGAVVERDGRVVWGRKAEGLRLAPGYWQVHRTTCADEALNRRIRAHANGRDRTLLSVHRRLRAHLESLQFDGTRAAALVADLKPDPARTSLSAEEYRAVLAGQCQRVADGEWFLVRDRFGRVHTPVTSLPRALRACLSVGGQRLVGLDLVNSQPLVAGLLARRCLRSRGARHRLRGAAFADAVDPYRHAPLDGLGPSPDEPPDLTEYLRVCAAGLFYESFTGPGLDRDRIKRGFMSVLMGPNQYHGPVKAAFEARFPTVARVLSELKSREHARAAWVLQNLEARIFIREIGEQLTAARPDLPLVTIHDSLFTTPGGLGDVRRAVLAAFARFGLTPTLKPC